ncbi:MAG: Unknown protein [uncultured Sulfurovum sp.]|uniref:Uncharacterized protein n=1 Tax=uncultured Sulfurovum sp. TaxID=269237 RepID=A0A6S6TZK4_9BACT|nr:MAG: Unknown protein [uncultured Sulfurovum sp.]
MKKSHQLHFKEFLYTFEMKTFKVMFVFFILLKQLMANEPSPYGYEIPNTPINIGGYIDAIYDDVASEKFVFDDVALLLSARYNRFDFLSEMEISELSLDGKSKGSSDIRINVERFQLTYALSDTENLIAGRFNSDIGYWNQAPINILQATTTKPHIFESIFPEHTTGLMYQNTISDEDSFSLTVQHSEDIGQKDKSLIVDRHFAMAYYKVYEDFSLRFATGFYRDKDFHNEAYYLGFGSEYEMDDFTLQAEFYTQSYDDEQQSYNAYLQSVWNFSPKHDVVLRLEQYNEQGVDDTIVLVGYVYRPTVNTALKTEYIQHSNHLPLNRFVSSFSVLF